MGTGCLSWSFLRVSWIKALSNLVQSCKSSCFEEEISLEISWGPLEPVVWEFVAAEGTVTPLVFRHFFRTVLHRSAQIWALQLIWFSVSYCISLNHQKTNHLLLICRFNYINQYPEGRSIFEQCRRKGSCAFQQQWAARAYPSRPVLPL